MKNRVLMAGLVGFAVSVGIATSAFADTIRQSITMSPQMVGQMSIEDLDVGDQVQLTLINPTNNPLVFRTTQQLGPDMEWIVPPRSQQVVEFTYNVPFSNDVNFLVIDPAGQTVAQGMLINIDESKIVSQTVTLQPGMGVISMDTADLDIGDTVVLTLVNPTSTPLTFEASEQLGPDKRWTVPPNSQTIVAFEYGQPFSDDVEYTVRQPTGEMISQGVLIPAGARPVTEGRATVRGYW